MSNDPWELRFDWILTALSWGTLTLGIIISFVAFGASGDVVAAAVAAGGYVVAMQAIPRRWRDSEAGGEIMSLVGVVVSLVAIALTGGVESPYTTFLPVPVFYAAAFHGFRMGLGTALLSVAGFAVVLGSLGQEILQPSFFQLSALYLLIAVTFAQARRILIEERERKEALDLASGKRLERLATAHNLLLSLSDLADSSELNSVTVGQAALRDLALAVPFDGGEVSISKDGEIVVARQGNIDHDMPSTAFPIQIGERTLGHLTLWPRGDRSLDEHRTLVEDALRPVALAFDNIQLLQEIARRAVREERSRVARELHDDIGPSLASLGLSMDLVLHQQPLDPETRDDLQGMRLTVTRLVEEVRGTVSDLRADQTVSLVERSHAVATRVGADGPAILIDIDEHRPPRSAIALELGAILTEAVRNALEHSNATLVRVEGTVDRDRGSLRITDDGDGFDAADSPRGHFGIIGMKERATEIGAVLDLSTNPGEGTRITIQWGEAI